TCGKHSTEHVSSIRERFKAAGAGNDRTGAKIPGIGGGGMQRLDAPYGDLRRVTDRRRHDVIIDRDCKPDSLARVERQTSSRWLKDQPADSGWCFCVRGRAPSLVRP